MSTNKPCLRAATLVAVMIVGARAQAQSAPPAAASAQPDATATPTPAQPAPPTSSVSGVGDTQVTLHDGSVIRGDLIERRPGYHLALRLATGQTRTIPWSAIAHEQPAGASAATPAVPPAATAPAATSVNVNFRADDERAGLQELRGRTWVTVCRSPCSQQLPSDGVYRIGGDGVRRSKAFALPAGQSQVNVDADVGTNSRTTGGVLLMVGGGIAAVIGLNLLVVGAFADSVHGIDDGDEFDSTGLTTAGAILTIGGVAAGVGGLVMLINNRTSVDFAGVNPSLRVALPGNLELTPAGLRF